jgi:hypothetical protein
LKFFIESDHENDGAQQTSMDMHLNTDDLFDDNGIGQKRRLRTQFTTEQKMYLLSMFRESSYPPREALEAAAKRLGVTVSILQTWFKNTRSKQKKLTHTKNL